jgi:FkbM family methyltransferase
VPYGQSVHDETRFDVGYLSLAALAQVRHRAWAPPVGWLPVSLGLLARPWKLSVFRFVAGHRRSAPVRYAARMATAFMAAYDNDDGSLVHDGELDLLRRVAAANPRIVLDVGAHHGEWSLAALDSLATATVYAIEPAPPNLRILRQRVAGRASVRVVEAALGEASGPATLHFDQRHPSTASLAGGPAGGEELFDVVVTTGDDLLAREGIEMVDLLKIDAEGWDLKVLQGFGCALANGRIRMVQFEMSPWNAVVRVWLKDFVDILVPTGFVLGRVFPGYVERVDYGHQHEDFRHRANMIAVREDDEIARWLFA